MLLTVPLLATSTAAWTTYEAYTTLISDYPDQLESDWTDECQGLTHDANYWYITHNDPVETWKILVGYDLADVESSWEHVLIAGIPSALSNEGYDHYGDPSYYYTGQNGYVLVPIEGGPCFALAFFRASDLAYVGHICMPLAEHGSAWCAVDPSTGRVYGVESSDSTNEPLVEYAVNWTLLDSIGQLEVDDMREIVLCDEVGTPFVLHERQGGAVTPSGRYIFITSGNANTLEPYNGIHVFDLETGWRIDRSTHGYGRFNFEWVPGGGEWEEPEGMTIWDLDNGSAPNIYGQLHVMLLDNDPDDDDIYLKHYRNTIYVQAGYPGSTGTPNDPLPSVAWAADGAWDGSRILVSAGFYPESVLVDNLTTLEVWGTGPAIIGTASLQPPRSGGEGAP
jgi:hypothetical protein